MAAFVQIGDCCEAGLRWHRTCRKRVLLAYRAETLQRKPIAIEAIQTMQGYSDAYAKAQVAFPDLAESPWPFRKVLASRCPHCQREIRYHSHDWKGEDVTHVLIGVDIGEQGRRLGVAPHAQWHWGHETRWPHWALLGGIGPISYHDPEPPPKRLHRKAG